MYLDTLKIVSSVLSRHIIPYRSTSNNATENVKQSAKYYATAAEKVRMKKKRKGCNKVDLKIRKFFL